MTDKSIYQDVVIGENWRLNAIAGQCHLDCQFDKEYEVKIILHDKLGREKFSIKFKAGASTKSLTLETTKLSAGKYHAWIYVGEKTFIREFQIEGKSGEKRGFMGGIFNFFS